MTYWTNTVISTSFYEFMAKYNFDVPFTVFYGLIDS